MMSAGESTFRGGARALRHLLSGIVDAPDDIMVTDVTLDSREVRPGALFLACRGQVHGNDQSNQRHGIEFAAQAAERGARAVIYETPAAGETRALEAAARLLQRVRQRAGQDEDQFVVAVPDLRVHLGCIADRFFGQPSQALQVVGVTGTNGKTTCAWLIAQALSLCGRPAAYIGTLGFGTPGALRPVTHTTADVISVHRQLALLRAGGAQAVAMEVSSHALDQGRVDEVRFDAAAFTNLTQDHLDYHGTLQAYGAAKARLFQRATLNARVINIDDAFGRELAGAAPAAGRLVVTGRASAPEAAAHVMATQVRALADGFDLTLASSWGDARLRVPLLGEFNVDNVLTTLAVLLAAQVPLAEALAALEQCVAAPGRMQRITGPASARHGTVIVDYAHTPDALEKALAAARGHCQGRLHLVFGCGGDRDRLKRPVMGRIAAAGADAVTVTDDNPRTEDPAAIVRDILSGITDASAKVRVEHDRATAIRSAIAGAAPGDLVLIAGKGHEDYQIYGATRRVFSDQQVARSELEAEA
ncbi:MAG TPA: UDP-N-acetylmuramoyl-L-alanyl-D-glutamate--2,6-diaminopimelate ligase [Steroidobacteraceae bacterium]|nr:UDP-N-acetylmuramoyl-L-alanyl-D-glutamate--2,6-diaminopimelate ligase [Steroidobacteraceae bacterium]